MEHRRLAEQAARPARGESVEHGKRARWRDLGSARRRRRMVYQHDVRILVEAREAPASVQTHLAPSDGPVLHRPMNATGMPAAPFPMDAIDGGFARVARRTPSLLHLQAAGLAPPPAPRPCEGAPPCPAPAGLGLVQFLPSLAHGLELLFGVLMGIMLAAVLVALGCWPGLGRTSEPDHMNPNPSATDLAAGRFSLPLIHYEGATFRQFNWTLDSGGDGVRVLAEDRRQVALASGRLMEGELHLRSGTGAWASLREPRRRRGHEQSDLWSFRVFRGDGSHFADVRQKSATTCTAYEPQPSRRKLMTVVGNFGYPQFLNGQRNINIWTHALKGDGVGAQCESRLEIVEAMSDSEWQPTEHPVRRFHVSCAANGTDASLVLAVLLGVQEVHLTLGRTSELQEQSLEAAPEFKGPEFEEQQKEERGQPSQTQKAAPPQQPATAA